MVGGAAGVFAPPSIPDKFVSPEQRQGESSDAWNRRRRAARKEWDAQQRSKKTEEDFARRAGRLGISPDELKKRLGQGGPPQARGATIGMSGTVQTVFGAMKVGVTEEVKRLDELIRLNKLVVDNTRTQALVP